MKDSSEYILQGQHNIFMEKPLEQRFLLAMQMIEDGLAFSKAAILNEKPTLTEKELKSELFKRIYGNEFSEHELQLISTHLNSH